MGPSYAGILGPIAFVTTLVRGVIGGGGADQALVSSAIHLLAFAAIGYVLGRVAEYVVLESVRQRFDRDLKAREQGASATLRMPATGTAE
jgi:hypothetical protein